MAYMTWANAVVKIVEAARAGGAVTLTPQETAEIAVHGIDIPNAYGLSEETVDRVVAELTHTDGGTPIPSLHQPAAQSDRGGSDAG